MVINGMREELWVKITTRIGFQIIRIRVSGTAIFKI